MLQVHVRIAVLEAVDHLRHRLHDHGVRDIHMPGLRGAGVVASQESRAHDPGQEGRGRRRD